MKPVPLSRLLSLAGRQLFRESRSGELRVLFFALLIAVASSTAIGYFSARLNGAMLARAAEFLGADLVLNGTQPASAEQIERGTRLGLRHADSVEFSSVIATDQGIQLSSIKAVGDRYPLRGQLKSAAAPFAAEQAGGRPQAGEVWVESRLLVSLDLKVGDSIEIGRKPLRIARILTYEPDRAGDFYSLTPRAMMSLADLDATGVVSRAAGCATAICGKARRKPSRPIASRSRAASPPTSACRMPATATARWAMPSAAPSAT